MKKSVILLIGVIYILAIVVVSFFGLKVETFNDTVYVEAVTITNEDIKPGFEDKTVVIYFNNDDPENPTSYQINWRVTPDDASRKIVKFIIEEKKQSIATVNEFGTVIFKKKGTVIVYVTATDGSAKKDSITIIAK